MPTYSLKDFRRGIDANIYQKDGIARVEHFDPINGQLRQFGAPTLSTSVAYGSSITGNALEVFAVSGTTIYALGMDSSSNHPAIFQWDSNAQNWKGLQTFTAGANAGGLILYKGDFYGLYNGTDIFKCSTGGVLDETHATLAYTNFALPFVHSKDNVAYFFTDNIVSSFTGTTASTALTLPTNFRITSACEDGDFILIVGYDTDGKATGYLWDRDSSLSTTTAKYDLGRDTPYLVARIGGQTMFISKRAESSNSAVSDQSVLVVRYRNGDRADIVSEHQMPTLGMAFNSMFLTTHSVYFGAYAKLRNDSAAKNVIFGLDYTGKLFIALNLGVNANTDNPSLMTGIIREGDGWWIGGQGNGSWHIANTYTTESPFETNIIRADALNHNVNFKGAVVTCESLPSGASIAIQGRCDAETAWTTLATFTTAAKMKFALTELVAKNALPTLRGAKQFQFRLVAIGISANPVIITGFMANYDELKDETYG
jgi:hypothetical protein